jgi:hypothetical protein
MARKASIIDYPREGLDESIWDIDGNTLKLQPRINDEIVDITRSFLDDLDLPEEAIIDVLLYGSMLTNQYNSKTDLDARILLDPEIISEHYPSMTGDELYDLTMDTIHGVLLADTQHPFNATVVIEGEDTELGQSPLGVSDRDPVYSMKEEAVIHEGTGYDETFDPDVEFMEERSEVAEIMTKLDALVQDAKTNTIDIELLEEAIGNVAEPDRLIEKIEDRLGDLNFTIEKMVDEYNKIKEERSTSYKEGPKDDRHKAPGNIRFKFLEKYRYLDMLKKLKRLFKGGIDPAEIDDVADTLNIRAYPYKQPGPPESIEAPPTMQIGPAAPTTIDRGRIDEGGMINQVQQQGSTCPRCGHVNPLTATDSDEITCESCGKKFNAKDGFSLGTGVSTIPETNPYSYESDFQLYGQTISPQIADDMVRMLRDMGISEDALMLFEKKLKGEPVEEEETRPEEPLDAQKPQQPGQLAPVTGQPPEIETGVKNVLKPGIQMNRQQAHLLCGAILMENLIDRLDKLRADSTGGTGGTFGEPPGKNPGDDPYSSGGGALAEYGKEDNGKPKKKQEPDDDVVWEILTVLEGVDILPFLEDDALLEELLAAFPLLGQASKKLDNILGQQEQIQQLSRPEYVDYFDLGFSREQIQKLLADLGLRQWSIGDGTLILKNPTEAIQFWEALQESPMPEEQPMMMSPAPMLAKEALITEPPEGTGQYRAPVNPDYDTEPKPIRRKRGPLEDGSGKGKGRPGGLRRNKNVEECPVGGPGEGKGQGQGNGINRKRTPGITQRRGPMEDGSGKGEGKPGGLRRNKNVEECPADGPGKGDGEGRGKGKFRKNKIEEEAEAIGIDWFDKYKKSQRKKADVDEYGDDPDYAYYESIEADTEEYEKLMNFGEIYYNRRKRFPTHNALIDWYSAVVRNEVLPVIERKTGKSFKWSKPDFDEAINELAIDALNRLADKYGKEHITVGKKKKANDEIKALVMDWLEENPDPSDDEVHALAEEIGMEPDDLEEVIYELATEHAEEDDLESDEETTVEDTEDPSEELTEEIAIAVGEEIGIDWEDSPFDPEQFLMGIKVELEHGSKDPETNVTDDDLIATAKIAWAHLKELDDYYYRLKEMEDGADKQVKSDDPDSEEASGAESSGGSVGGFKEGFPGKTAAAYMTLCPQCKTIQKAPIEGEGITCPFCNMGWLDSLEISDPKKYQEYKMHTEQESEKLQERRRDQRGAPRTAARVDRKIIAQINKELRNAGMDGNGRFETAGTALMAAANILSTYGVQAASDVSSTLGDADILTEEFRNEGTKYIELETLGGEPIQNTQLVFQYYQFLETGKYEVLAMLS